MQIPSKYRQLMLWALVTAVALIDTSCTANQKAAVHAKTPDTPAVYVAKASLEDISQTLILTAEFKPFQEVEVMAKVAGYVKKINVDTGDRVQQGQLLATLEIPEMADDINRGRAAVDRSLADVERAKDEVQRAESAHQMAHLSFHRLADVAKRQAGLVAQQEVDSVHSRDLESEAQVNAAKSNLNMLQQQVQVSAAELQKVQTLLDYTRVTAPFAGVVTKRYADTGSLIQAGISSSTQVMPLVKLTDNSTLRLVLPVPEAAVSRVRVGQTVEIHVPALRRSFPGKIARFSSKLAPATRTMDTEVDVSNPGLLLIPGMTAKVVLTFDQQHGVVTIPIPAVEAGTDDSAEVVVVTPDSRTVIRQVTLGVQSATKVEVRFGLRAGELVVLGNRANLRADQLVRPNLAENYLQRKH